MKKFLFILFVTTVAQAVSAQPADERRDFLASLFADWRYQVGGGVAVGGTAPLPMPRSIRRIEAFNPLLNLYVEGLASRPVVGRWGIAAGLRLERKGMKTKAQVKNYRMEMTADDGAFMEGAWTGHVETRVRSVYLTLPLLATCSLGRRWQVSAGPYLSLCVRGNFGGAAYDGYIRHYDPTGEKAYVTHATYDFGDDVRRWAWGVQAGAAYRCTERISAQAALDWGLTSVFHSGFTAVTFPLRPIYGRVGAAYLF